MSEPNEGRKVSNTRCRMLSEGMYTKLRRRRDSDDVHSERVYETSYGNCHKGDPAMEQRVGSERVERSATDNNRIGATTAEDAPTDTF